MLSDDTQTGFAYRTSTMTEEHAATLAAALRENTAFSDVRLCHSVRAGDKQWFVRFAPSRAEGPLPLERRQESLDAALCERMDRAVEEHFTFTWNADMGAYFCDGAAGSYMTTLSECSCGEWEYRGRETGDPCRHMCALLSALERGDLPEPMPRGLLDLPCESCGAETRGRQAISVRTFDDWDEAVLALCAGCAEKGREEAEEIIRGAFEVVN